MSSKFGAFEGSVVSYPDRGSDGNFKWRGNSSGHLTEQFLRTYHIDKQRQLDVTGLFVDPTEGGGTSRDVAKRIGLQNYRGFDLHSGFDLTHDDLLTKLEGQQAKTVFFHPPYFNIVRYSNSVWGNKPHPADLSECGLNEELFFEMLQAMIFNISRAVEPGGTYGILVGNVKKNGKFYHMAHKTIALAPDELIYEIIKTQHNCSSDTKNYGGAFVPIRHEELLIFRRAEDATTFAMSLRVAQRLEHLMEMTWRNLVVAAVRAGEAVTAKDVAERLAEHPRAKAFKNPETLQAKIRQIFQVDFQRVSRGVWALPQAA